MIPRQTVFLSFHIWMKRWAKEDPKLPIPRQTLHLSLLNAHNVNNWVEREFALMHLLAITVGEVLLVDTGFCNHLGLERHFSGTCNLVYKVHCYNLVCQTESGSPCSPCPIKKKNAWCSSGNMDTSQFDYNVYYKRADIMSKSTCDTPALSFIEHKFTLNKNFAIDQKSGVPWKSHWGCIALRLNWICARLISSHILKVEQWPPFGKNSQIIP